MVIESQGQAAKTAKDKFIQQMSAFLSKLSVYSSFCLQTSNEKISPDTKGTLILPFICLGRVVCEDLSPSRGSYITSRDSGE